MARGALLSTVLALAGCSAAAAPSAPPAPTPEIIYVTQPPAPPVAAPTPIIIYVTQPPAPSGTVHTVTGTFTLNGKIGTEYVLANNGKSCIGQDGYSDIAPGLTVVVKDQTGSVIATGGLVGRNNGTCVFDFTVANVPDEPFYSIEVGHRGALTYSNTDLTAAGWTVAFSLGTP